MKGTLKNKEGKWVVIYAERSQNETEQIKSKYKKIIELPLHPEQQSLTPNPFNNYGKGQEVEFEIFEIFEIDKCVGICMKMAHDYSDNAEVCLSGCEDIKKVAKLITKQEEKLYEEIDNKDGSITLVPKDPDFGKIFPFGEQESWGEIFERHWKECEHNHMTNFQEWLKLNYNPPTKK